MLLDAHLILAGFRSYATYRAATIAGLFTNIVFGFLRGAILLAAIRQAGDIGGYSTTDALAYVWLTQGLIAVIAIWNWNELALRIESGDIATDLTRPIDPQRYWLARDFGRAAYALCIRGIGPVAVGFVLFDVTVPPDVWQWMSFVVSVALAVWISFGLRFIVNLAPIWLRDWRGALIVSNVLATLMSGFLMPIAWFPHWARVVMHALPWAGTTQAPIDVFLGKASGPSGIATIGLQAAWGFALFVCGRFALIAGTRKLVVHGG